MWSVRGAQQFTVGVGGGTQQFTVGVGGVCGGNSTVHSRSWWGLWGELNSLL